MIESIAKIFIKNYQDVKNPAVRQRYGVLSGMTGILLNLLLFVGKLLAGVLTGAISVTADAFNNLGDAGSSIVTLVGFRMAGKPADGEHPFGHGRIEYIAGLLVSLAILVMGVELLSSSFDKILHPEEVDFSWLSVAILAASVAVKLWMGYFNRALGRYIGSVSMKATSIDSISDATATSTVIVGILVGHFSDWMVDGYVGCAVALFILYSGFMAARDTLQPLLGQPPEASLVREIEKAVLAYPQIVGIHDLVVHNYGPGRTMISLHAEVSNREDIQEIHDVVDLAEMGLKEKFNCDAVIHMDPIVTDDEATNTMRRKVASLVKVIDPRLTIHDFRMTDGPTHRNLIFDVQAPYGFRLTDQELIASIRLAVRTLDERNYAVVRIDKVSPQQLEDAAP